jgi:hypothetical protein
VFANTGTLDALKSRLQVTGVIVVAEYPCSTRARTIEKEVSQVVSSASPRAWASSWGWRQQPRFRSASMSSTELLGGSAPSGNHLSSSGIWFQSVAQSLGGNANSNISDVFACTSSRAASVLIGLQALFVDSKG